MAFEIARAVSDRGELVLRARKPHRPGEPPVLELRANGIFVIDTAETTSEVALAKSALAEVGAPERVLVGGLGLGFTMRAVLSDQRVRSCDAIEIEPALVEWMRDGTIPDGSQLFDDPRSRVIVADVADFIKQTGPGYDLILMDVDNGPGYLVHQVNEALYGSEFLTGLRGRLTPNGAVVFWAANRSPALLATLQGCFARAHEIACPVTLQGRHTNYWLYSASQR